MKNVKLYMNKPLLLKTVCLALVKCCAVLCCFALIDNQKIPLVNVVFGGITVEESNNLVYVVLCTVPEFLFCNYISNSFIKELKTNFIYIFLRETNRSKWMVKTVYKIIVCIVFYEILSMIILFIVMCIVSKMSVVLLDFLGMLVLYFLKMLVLAVLTNYLLLRFQETIAIFSNMLMLIVPVFATGMLFSMRGKWEQSVLLIPFNWGNYNYVTQAQYQPIIFAICLVVLYYLLYKLSEKCLKGYELI